MIAQRQRQNC